MEALVDADGGEKHMMDCKDSVGKGERSYSNGVKQVEA